jgi:alpha-tubulin suppressor-like RCC1 family protein
METGGFAGHEGGAPGDGGALGEGGAAAPRGGGGASGDDGDGGGSGAGGDGGAATSGPGGAIWLTAGVDHTCIVVTGGAVRCWGDNQYSQLGQGPNSVDGRIGDDEPASAAQDVEVGGEAIQVAGGKFSSCAILSGGRLRCWGGAALGYPPPEEYIGDDEIPASAGDVNVGGTVTSVAMGLQHTCALLATQAVRCWGVGVSHQLGYANTGNLIEANTGGDLNMGGTVAQLAAGMNHNCALLTNGSVRCWGSNDFGQLGYARVGNVSMFETPADNGDVTVGGKVKQVTAGGAHSCALLESGAVRCWGRNQYGQLGYGNLLNIGDTETPASAGDVDVGAEVQQIAAGDHHTCALLVGGAVRCWGSGSLGYPDNNAVGDDETPASVGDIELGAPASHIAAGGDHTCALLPGGTVRCWGSANKGELGYGTPLIGNIGDNESPANAGDVPW